MNYKKVGMIVATILWIGFAVYLFQDFSNSKDNEKSYTESENVSLSHFLHSRNENTLTLDTISRRLFDIQTEEGTSGRAIAIGQGYFLSAWHVVREGKEYCVVLQAERIHGTCFPIYILTEDSDKDLVLLKSPVKNAKINLPMITLTENSTYSNNRSYSFYKVLTGKNTGKNFQVTYEIEEHYMPEKERKKYPVHLNYNPDIRLFEINGYLMTYDTKRIEKIYKNHSDKENSMLYNLSKEEEYLFSFPVFNGDSGSGIFIKDHRGNLVLTGIVLRAWNTAKMISTPNNPLGHRAIQATITFAANRKSIESFIINYINRGY